MSFSQLHNRVEEAERKVAQLSAALEKAELKLDQYKKAGIIQKLHISQLESIILQVRNCVTPRVMQKISAEQDPILPETE